MHRLTCRLSFAHTTVYNSTTWIIQIRTMCVRHGYWKGYEIRYLHCGGATRLDRSPKKEGKQSNSERKSVFRDAPISSWCFFLLCLLPSGCNRSASARRNCARDYALLSASRVLIGRSHLRFRRKEIVGALSPLRRRFSGFGRKFFTRRLIYLSTNNSQVLITSANR